jgi:16S rRNA C1402 (ribose-2'-O) methylase RsmI
MVREGTKIHEEIREGECDEVLAELGAKPLGEFTLVVAGAEVLEDRISIDPLDLLRFATELGLSPESAARRVAETFDVPRSRLLRRSRDDESPKRPRTL